MKPRAVVDTNILIRAVIRPQGTVGPIATRLRDAAFVIILSVPLFEKLIEKLNLPRIRTKYHIDAQTIETFVAELAARGELVTPTRQIQVCRDQDDNAVLEAAVAGRANFIVSGDEDLLILDPFEGIRIVPPHIFLAALTASTTE
jgi:putative PIN family toxin of toxin-antitoxin system